MNDKQLIDFCDKHCKTPKALFAHDRVNRMIELAGNPRGYEPLIYGKFATMRGEMQILVNLARKRMARPKGGVNIEAGKAYRDVNGDVRYVIAITRRFSTPAVLWDTTPGDKPQLPVMLLHEFKEWAIEEVNS